MSFPVWKAFWQVPGFFLGSVGLAWSCSQLFFWEISRNHHLILADLWDRPCKIRTTPFKAGGVFNVTHYKCLTFSRGNLNFCIVIYITGWWQLKHFLFSPRTLGKIPILTHIFQMSWFNHQPDHDVLWVFHGGFEPLPTTSQVCSF